MTSLIPREVVGNRAGTRPLETHSEGYVPEKVVLSITSGGNGQCNANNQNYRVDTPQARAFLGQFLTLP